MSDETRGVYRKFEVRRTDGSSGKDGKHARCRYFVLDLDHDKHAAAALAAYSDSCRDDYPILSAELNYTAEQIENHDPDDGRLLDGVDLGWKRGHFWGEDEWGRRDGAAAGAAE